ncbi:MAG: DUF2062 domain-containing protein [Chryseolinea sp.]
MLDQLFDPNESDRTKALSVGFGIFMGIIPLWGFQLAIAIPLSFVFKLNKVLVFLAANISILPMIPLILFLSHLTGAFWMGDKAEYISFSKEITLELVKNNAVQYILGACTLATVAGVIFGLVTYAGLKIFKRSNS